MASPAPAVKRSIIYIDGFNFYYGAIKDGPNRWLNLQRYFTMVRQHDDIRAIRYFTAMIDGPHAAHQVTYLKALSTLPLVDIVLGRFKAKTITCRASGCGFTGSRRFTSQEEKRTDVNIAIAMLDDAYQDLCDRFIVISGDSDLVPAIAQIKARFPEKQVIVYIPARDRTRGAATELRTSADKHRTLPLEKLPHAHFPATIADSGGTITKPASW